MAHAVEMPRLVLVLVLQVQLVVSKMTFNVLNGTLKRTATIL